MLGGFRNICTQFNQHGSSHKKAQVLVTMDNAAVLMRFFLYCTTQSVTLCSRVPHTHCLLALSLSLLRLLTLVTQVDTLFYPLLSVPFSAVLIGLGSVVSQELSALFLCLPAAHLACRFLQLTQQLFITQATCSVYATQPNTTTL